MEKQQYILNTLAQMQSLIYNADSKKVIQDIKDRDIVLFLGNTRAGKSTTVNYVIGNSLQAIQQVKKRYKIISATEQYTGPTIGLGSVSETSVPTAWTSTRISGVVVDAPGFGDNRGEAQDVANAFYIKELLTYATSVKFVIICDIDTIINDNIGQFVNLINTVNTMIPQCNSLQSGMVLAFTKDELNTTREEACEYMKDKILNQSQIQIDNKPLVQFFADNPNNIVIIKMPTAEGIIKEEDGVFDDLINSIEYHILKMSREAVSAVMPGISDKSRRFMLEARASLSELREFDGILKEAENNFTSQVNQNDITCVSIEHGQGIINRLAVMDQSAKTLLNSTMSGKELIQGFSALVPSVSGLQDIAKIEMMMKFVEFIDQVLQIGSNNLFITKVKTVLGNMCCSVAQCTANINDKIARIRAAEEERRLREKEEALRVQREQEEQRRLAELQRINAEQEKMLIFDRVFDGTHRPITADCVIS